jgi:hypothetical protein
VTKHRVEVVEDMAGSVKLKVGAKFVDAWPWRSRGELTMETGPPGGLGLVAD